MYSQPKSALKSILYNYLGRIGSQAINFFVSIYVIRELPVQMYGEYSVLFSIMAYVLLFTSLGLESVIQRYIPEFMARKNYRQVNNLVGLGIVARFSIGLLVVSFLYIFAKPLGNWLNLNNLPVYLSIFGWIILINVATLLLDIVLTSLLKQFVTNFALLFSVVVRGVGFYYLISHEYQLLDLLFVELIAISVRGIILMVAFCVEAVRFHHSSISSVSEENLDRKRLVRFGSWAYLNQIGYLFFNTDTDNFIISNFLGQNSVGLYAFANKIGGIIVEWSPIAIASNVISPLFYGRYSERQDPSELNKMFGMLNKVIYVFFVPILAGLIALNERFVSLIFGDKYNSAVWLVIGVLFYQVLNAYQYPLGLVVFAIEKNQINFFSRIFSIYNLVADLIFIRFWGVPGVLIATATAITFKNLFIYFWTLRYVKLSWDWKLYGRLLFNGLIMGLIVWQISRYASTLGLLFIDILIGAVIYLILLFMNGIFTNEEISLVNKVFGRKVIPDFIARVL